MLIRNQLSYGTFCTGWFKSYAHIRKHYEARAVRSRTYSPLDSSVKAVRLDTMVSKGSHIYSTKLYTVYRDGLDKAPDYVFRLYDTDIVTWRADDTLHINLNTRGGHCWESATTLYRVSQICGVRLYTAASSVFKLQGSNNVRILMANTHEGAAPSWIRGTIPFNKREGVWFSILGGEIFIQPADYAKLESDRRAEYLVPAKTLVKRFTPQWKVIEEQLGFSVKLGEVASHFVEIDRWGDKHMELPRGDIDWAVAFHQTCRAILAGEETGEYLIPAFIHHTRKHRHLYPQSLASTLLMDIPTFRNKLLASCARESTLYDTKGGQILGKGYFVAERDKESTK